MAKKKKIFYKIGEACKQLDIQPYVLRYWETEFPSLSPNKSKSGQRVYSEKELEVIRRIKQLLYDEGYTIAGAKKKLEAELAAGGPGETPEGEAPKAEVVQEAKAAVKETEGELEDLRSGLQDVLAEARDLLSYLDARAEAG